VYGVILAFGTIQVIWPSCHAMVGPGDADLRGGRQLAMNEDAGEDTLQHACACVLHMQSCKQASAVGCTVVFCCGIPWRVAVEKWRGAQPCLLLGCSAAACYSPACSIHCLWYCSTGSCLARFIP
jgi:hypothetical protein